MLDTGCSMLDARPDIRRAQSALSMAKRLGYTV
jgi:hypothetical protein